VNSFDSKLLGNLLVAVNGSESSFHAAQYAILIGKEYRSHVKAVYVVDTMALQQLTLNRVFLPEERNSYEEHLKLDGKKHLQQIASWGREHGVTVETEMRRGGVWSEVVTAAKDWGANLILLGGLLTKRTTGGASTREILENAPCSVLVVREPQLQQQFR
jgi:nucleotide-binding universal stress UspA family protein